MTRGKVMTAAGWWGTAMMRNGGDSSSSRGRDWYVLSFGNKYVFFLYSSDIYLQNRLHSDLFIVMNIPRPSTYPEQQMMKERCPPIHDHPRRFHVPRTTDEHLWVLVDDDGCQCGGQRRQQGQHWCVSRPGYYTARGSLYHRGSRRVEPLLYVSMSLSFIF
jgi:hypothetical protein